MTIDLVRPIDGVWRVVEMGEGQVSDRPSTKPAETLIDALLERQSGATLGPFTHGAR